MGTVKFVVNRLVGISLLAASSVAWAHYPLMQCWSQDDVIECEAGYSDGSKAVDYAVSMYDYDDNLIAKVETDNRSIATFKRTVNEFYIVFDSGHEFPVEVDGVEVVEK